MKKVVNILVIGLKYTIKRLTVFTIGIESLKRVNGTYLSVLLKQRKEKRKHQQIQIIYLKDGLDI